MNVDRNNVFINSALKQLRIYNGVEKNMLNNILNVPTDIKNNNLSISL